MDTKEGATKIRAHEELLKGLAHLTETVEPSVLDARLRDAIDEYRDPDLWEEAVEEEEGQREILTACASRWDEVAALLGDLP